MKILGQRVLAVEYEPEEEPERKTEGGIIIPETAKKEFEGSNVFTVVAVGTGVEEESLVEGAVILVPDRTVTGAGSATLDGQEVKVFNEGQILGVAEDAK